MAFIRIALLTFVKISFKMAVKLFNDTHKYIGIFDNLACVGMLCLTVDYKKSDIAFLESLVVANEFKNRFDLTFVMRAIVKMIRINRILVVIHRDFRCKKMFLDAGLKTLAKFNPTVEGAPGFEILKYNEGNEKGNEK